MIALIKYKPYKSKFNYYMAICVEFLIVSFLVLLIVINVFSKKIEELGSDKSEMENIFNRIKMLGFICTIIIYFIIISHIFGYIYTLIAKEKELAES